MHRAATCSRLARSRSRAALACAAGAVCLLASGVASGAKREEAFLEGYATAVVEGELGVPVAEIAVERGVARIVLRDLGGVPAYRVAERVVRVDGIDRVEVRAAEDGRLLAEAGAAASGDRDREGVVLLPPTEVFDPLLADPRQPHFAAVYQWYLDDRELDHVGSANFGETFALVEGPLGSGRWQLGLLGGVFSVFDLDAESYDLVNSDFWVGPTLSARRGILSGQVRLYHQSSHLGDEFLLRNRTERVNLSYEGVDALVSVDVHEALRIYAGGGVIVHDEPDLDPLSAQAGAELRSPKRFAGQRVRPIAGFDFQAREENDWREEYGAAAGVELANPDDAEGLRLQLLVTYFKGNSPNGQFFQRRIEWIGVGGHLHF